MIKLYILYYKHDEKYDKIFYYIIYILIYLYYIYYTYIYIYILCVVRCILQYLSALKPPLIDNDEEKGFDTEEWKQVR